jgi:hypothetical protein
MARESLIKGGIPVGLSLLLLVCIDQFTEAPVPERLLDIVAANLTADLLIISVAFYSGLVRSTSLLLTWYTQYGLSAVLMDTLIGVIYMSIGFEILQTLQDRRLVYFGLISVAVQWVGDLLFYVFFRLVPPRKNAVLDFFKAYAAEAQLGALLGDTFLVVFAVLLSSALALVRTERYVVYVLVVAAYAVPYVVHTDPSESGKVVPAEKRGGGPRPTRRHSFPLKTDGGPRR